VRFEGDYDEQFPGQWWLWEANLQRNISGKAGQRSLRELRDALLALPEKKLIETRLADEQGHVCALGALAVKQRVERGEPREKVLAAMASDSAPDEYGMDIWEAEQQTLAEAKACGVKGPMAVTIAWENDFGPSSSETPEQRYARVLAWVEKRILERQT
jgi:hypothetical protein